MENQTVFFQKYCLILLKNQRKINQSSYLVLISSLQNLNILKIKNKFKLIDLKNYNPKDLSYKRINICNIDYNFKKPFEKISAKSNQYISACFDEALKFSKKNKISGLINGPISKKFFLGKKFFGITEYLASKQKIRNKFAMLIYSRNLSVSPVTTHLPINKVAKNLNKEQIIKKVLLISNFFYLLIKKNQKLLLLV